MDVCPTHDQAAQSMGLTATALMNLEGDNERQRAALVSSDPLRPLIYKQVLLHSLSGYWRDNIGISL